MFYVLSNEVNQSLMVGLERIDLLPIWKSLNISITPINPAIILYRPKEAGSNTICSTVPVDPVVN